MSTALAALLAAIPNALLAIGAKLFTDAFFQKVLTRVLIAGLKKAAAMSTNTVDDSIVADIEERLRDQ